MYLVIKSAYRDTSEGRVIMSGQPIFGFEVVESVPNYVTKNNEFVYVDLSTLTDDILENDYQVETIDEYINMLATNLDVVILKGDAINKTLVGHATLSVPSIESRRDTRKLDDSEWDPLVHLAWLRLAHTSSMAYL